MGDCFQVGTNFLTPHGRIYGDVSNDGWDDLELEFEEFLALYTFLYMDDSRKDFWDHECLDWSQYRLESGEAWT
jgi:hypothetical protein